MYRVIVRETVHRTHDLEADSLQDAREIAEEQDWRTYTLDTEEPSDSEIVEVVYLGETD